MSIKVLNWDNGMTRTAAQFSEVAQRDDLDPFSEWSETVRIEGVTESVTYIYPAVFTAEHLKFWAASAPMYDRVPTDTEVMAHIRAAWSGATEGWRKLARQLAGRGRLKSVTFVGSPVCVDTLLAGVRVAAPSLKAITGYALWALTDPSVPAAVAQTMAKALVGVGLSESSADPHVSGDGEERKVRVVAHRGTALVATRNPHGEGRLTITLKFGSGGSNDRAVTIVHSVFRWWGNTTELVGCEWVV